MGQEDKTKTVTLPLQELTAVDASDLVNTYAEDLISNLFEDVDRLLDGDETVVIEIQRGVSISPSLGSKTDEDTPDADETPSTALALSETATQDQAVTETALTSEVSPTPTAEKPQKTRLGKLLDRCLITTTVFSLLGILGFVIYSYQRSNGWVNPFATQPGDPQMATQSDQEFLEYLDRSLEVIARKVERNAEATDGIETIPDVSVLPASPPLLPPLSPPPGAPGVVPPGGVPGGGPVNVIERVYIPYQTTTQPTLPQVPQTAQVPQGTVNAPRPEPGLPAANHTLVGLLELGERSAALFEIDGVSQRVYIGEPIGNSGWNLVSVSSDEARIRRNGEVRSIYIGQKF
jgi:hypothetical protein